MTKNKRYGLRHSSSEAQPSNIIMMSLRLLGSWEHLKTLMHAHYHHLHDADMAKQKLRTITQRQKETIPQYTDRLKLLAKH